MLKFLAGLFIGASVGSAWAVTAYVNTNGVLTGYVVQKDGEEVCRDPDVWNQFRGPTSYIVCPDG